MLIPAHSSRSDCTLSRQHDLGLEQLSARARDREQPASTGETNRTGVGVACAGIVPELDPMDHLAGLLLTQLPLRQVGDQLFDRPQ
jgi:hypothetical protein